MKFRILLLSLFFSLPVIAQDNNDQIFLAARDGFRANDSNKLEKFARQLANYELASYVENYRLRLSMEQGDTSSMRSFLERNEKSYVAEKLRADWIRWLGKRTSWNEVVSEYPKLLAPEVDVTCYSQQARLARDDNTVLDEIGKQWLTLLEPPEACSPLFDALANQRMNSDDIWARARLQLEINRPNWTRTTLNYLPDSQMPNGKALDTALNKAMPYLISLPSNWFATRTGRELAVFAIQRIAFNDPRIAADQLERLQSHLQDPEKRWAWGQIALRAAKGHQPEALAWYSNAGKFALSDEAVQWKVRAALRAQEWGVVRDTIQAMPTTLAAQASWIYWLGRAQKAGGKTTEAGALFEKIADQANFYGNLANEELGRPVMPPPKASPSTIEEQNFARDNPGIRRALAFFRLDLRLEGVREWNWALRDMTDRQLLAVADLAKRNQIWDRAINTANKTTNEHDYNLRFLAPYGDQVRPAARTQLLDDAWVYGLMRQESRFITSAKSNVGASGLMQLMPATAKWVAKKIGLRDFSHSQVNDTETNLLLGTSYMRLVMENLNNHPVLASAAYNAGPGRAKKWLADQPLEGAIYAETIPFSETRDYVEKVMSNAMYYSTIFNGKPDSLKARLGTVSARTQLAPKEADLP